jgi:hypothetical protein
VINLNDNNIDKETFKKIVGALQGMKDMAQKTQQKQELKIWSDITFPITLKDALTRLSKDELSAIRNRLDIKKASHLNKGDLIELFNQRIPALLEKIFINMDQERYSIIKKIIRNGGFIEEPKLAAHQIEYFRSNGILFTGTNAGKKILVIPEEIVKSGSILEHDKKFMSTCQRNTEWIKLSHGILYYYGSLTIQELLDLLKKYTNDPVNVSDYLSVMRDASSYYQQIRMDRIGFSNIEVFDPEKVKREHLIRKDLEFFPFSKDQLLRAGEPEYIERNDRYLQFVHFLTQNYEISRQEADGIVEECAHATKIGEAPNRILQFLQSRLEFKSIDSVKACMDKVISLMNHSRQWFLKGYTPEELIPHEQKSLRPLPDRKNNIVDFATRKKIGRNDLCPCGSNKKCKNCCGK